VSDDPVTGAARRSTPQKAAIRDALNHSDAFVSAQDLHRALERDGVAVGLATVYRNLAEMAERGEADVLQAEPGVQLYRACGPQHHHHLSCVQCGRTIEIEAPVEDWVDAVAAEHGFVRTRHVVDVFGVCADCRATDVTSA
jgi:Fur family transcriptional regulator, ferric uptake regulator